MEKETLSRRVDDKFPPKTGFSRYCENYMLFKLDVDWIKCGRWLAYIGTHLSATT